MFFVIMLVVAAVFLLAASVILIVRKGQPIGQNKITYKSDEERVKSQKAAFIMGIMLLIQSIAMILLAGGIHFDLWVLHLTAYVMFVPVIIWAIKTVAKKKSK